jgi:hypothetical protein
MSRLKAALQREYEDDPNTKMELHNPRNTVAIELYFRGEKTAKVMGTLAMEKPRPGHKLSGILVKRNFNYHMLAACDLSSELEVFVTIMLSCYVTNPLRIRHSGTEFSVRSSRVSKWSVESSPLWNM